MFMGLGDVRLAIEGSPPKLFRKLGLFRRKQIELNRVIRVFAENTDALTHDCIWLTLVADNGDVLQMSEFDRNFQSVVAQLAKQFPGTERFIDTTPRAPFSHTRITLWAAPNELSP